MSVRPTASWAGVADEEARRARGDLLLRLFVPSDVWDTAPPPWQQQQEQQQSSPKPQGEACTALALVSAAAAAAEADADAELSAHVNGLADVPGGLLWRRYEAGLSGLARKVLGSIRGLHDTASLGVEHPRGRQRRRTLGLFVVLFCLVQEPEFRGYVVANSANPERAAGWIDGFLHCTLEAYFRGVSVSDVRSPRHSHPTAALNRNLPDLVSFCVAHYVAHAAPQ